MKKQKWLVTIGGKKKREEEAGTYLMAKLHAVYASPLNYVQFSKNKKFKYPHGVSKKPEVQRKIQNTAKNDRNAHSRQGAQRP